MQPCCRWAHAPVTKQRTPPRARTKRSLEAPQQPEPALHQAVPEPKAARTRHRAARRPAPARLTRVQRQPRVPKQRAAAVRKAARIPRGPRITPQPANNRAQQPTKAESRALRFSFNWHSADGGRLVRYTAKRRGCLRANEKWLPSSGSILDLGLPHEVRSSVEDYLYEGSARGDARHVVRLNHNRIEKRSERHDRLAIHIDPMG